MNIIKNFQKIKLLINNNYYYLTLNELTLEDINDNINIAKLLLFDCNNNFDDLDYTKEITNYIISIYLKDTSDPITIITYICQIDAKRESAIKLLKKIKRVLIDNTQLKNILLDVKLDIKVIYPVQSFIPKLINHEYTFNEEETKEMNYIINNIININDSERIIVNINYNNTLHRGIMLSFISIYEYNILEPFYPLQNNGLLQIEQIENVQTDLILKILNDSQKIEVNIIDNYPPKSLIPKLINNKYTFSEEEKKQMNDIIHNIFNIKDDKIIKENINYDNILHRGMMLSFICIHDYNILEPFYLLKSDKQSQINEIKQKQTDLIFEILNDSNNK